MSQFQQNIELIRSESLTPDIVRLTFHAPEIAAAAHPGQFVMVQTSASLDPLLRRPFSIHQVGRDGTVQILFKALGKGTARLARQQPGTFISLLGPLGNGFSGPASAPACLVGGGLGIAPLLFLASRFQQQGINPSVILGARTSAELLPLLADFHNLGLTVQTTTDDGSLGVRGFVTDILKNIPDPVHSPPPVVYACGPKPMMAAVFVLCQRQKFPCQVSLETTMACGFGACLGCAVPVQRGGYAHVCTDGPVFAAEELVWSL